MLCLTYKLKYDLKCSVVKFVVFEWIFIILAVAVKGIPTSRDLLHIG